MEIKPKLGRGKGLTDFAKSTFDSKFSYRFAAIYSVSKISYLLNFFLLNAWQTSCQPAHGALHLHKKLYCIVEVFAIVTGSDVANVSTLSSSILNDFEEMNLSLNVFLTDEPKPSF